MKNRKRNRMAGFDYTSNHVYFVTVCVQNRLCCFGSVISEGAGRDLSVQNPHDKNPHDSPQNYKMQLNQFGLIVEEKINWLEQHYLYVEIHNYVVMPNHIHILLEINSTKISGLDVKIKSLSSIIGALKTTSSKEIHLKGLNDFSWQRSFHDHIVKNEPSYLNIDNYINLNAKNWYKDVFFNQN